MLLTGQSVDQLTMTCNQGDSSFDWSPIKQDTLFR